MQRGVFHLEGGVFNLDQGLSQLQRGAFQLEGGDLHLEGEVFCTWKEGFSLSSVLLPSSLFAP